MATKKQISDAILYRLAGGIPDSGFPIDERDIWDALESKLNTLFKVTHFNQTLPSGETIPDNLMIATYDNISVTSSYSGKSKSTLPIVPISLPRGMGINEIKPILSQNTSDSNLILGNPFIPFMAGQDFLLKADSLLNDLMGQIGYTPSGKIVEYTKDITTFGITKVSMKLVVFDMSQYGVSDELPIPADFVGQLEDELTREYAAVLPESGVINNFSNAGQTIPNNAATNNK